MYIYIYIYIRAHKWLLRELLAASNTECSAGI